jgi:hypothetical protein
VESGRKAGVWRKTREASWVGSVFWSAAARRRFAFKIRAYSMKAACTWTAKRRRAAALQKGAKHYEERGAAT